MQFDVTHFMCKIAFNHSAYQLNAIELSTFFANLH